MKAKKKAKIEMLDVPVRGMEFREILHSHADIICDHFAKVGMAGYVVIGFGFDGSFSRGTRLHPDAFIGHTLLPSFIAEILRRDISKDVTLDVLEGKA